MIGGYLAHGYLPRSSEKGLGSLHAACSTKTAGRLTHLWPQWAWYIDLKPVFKHSPLLPLSAEEPQLLKQRPTDVKGLWEWVCLRLPCLCLLHCCLCFFLPLPFTLFSWEREDLCLELELQVVDYMGVWDDRTHRNVREL